MKKIYSILALALIALAFMAPAKAQTSPGKMPTLDAPVPWTETQLLEPSELATLLQHDDAAPLIYNIGAVEDIKGAKHIGAVNNTENLEKFKKALADLPKNTAIVIYCGCCPFAKCPNVRPAFAELTKTGFTNIKLLNIPVNLKTNWINKGYPLAGK